MIGIIFGSTAVVIAVLALVLQRLYSSVPARELKRLAQRGDPLAKALYRPVSYGASMRLFLWLVLSLSLSVGLVLLLPSLPAVAGFALLMALVAVTFVWVPSMRLTVQAAQFAAFFAPAVAFALSYLTGLLSRVASYINNHRDLSPHSQLYEKDDLLTLLDLQKEQVDNRIVQEQLELADRALRFADKQAADIVRLHKELHLVDADDTVGPILLDQLHKSGQTSFLVYKDSQDNIIGSLALKDAVSARKDIRVFDLIRNDLAFIHEDFTLRQVLTAFQYTGQHVAVVINSFEEFLGTVTLDDLLKALFGDLQEPAVESFENRVSVAAYKPIPLKEQASGTADATLERKVQKQAGDMSSDTPSPEATEVVE